MAFSVTDFKSKGLKRGGARSALFSVSLLFPHTSANLNTESGRNLIAEKLLEMFVDKHIIFYTDLEKHNEETIERGL